MKTIHRGDLSEAMILAAFLRAGRVVLKPISNGERYDLVIDNRDGTFSRVQCKTGRLRNGGIIFPTCSTGNGKDGIGRRRDYRGQADIFAIFCPDNNLIYLMPVDEVPLREACLRIDPPRKKGRPGRFMATDYQFFSV
jgi:hypothetical protein